MERLPEGRNCNVMSVVSSKGNASIQSMDVISAVQVADLSIDWWTCMTGRLLANGAVSTLFDDGPELILIGGHPIAVHTFFQSPIVEQFRLADGTRNGHTPPDISFRKSGKREESSGTRAGRMWVLWVL